jgi:broad specificity phosphatase PhoE
MPIENERLVYFVRHGQSEHNASLEERELTGDDVLELYATQFPDSRLTTRGISEAVQLKEAIDAAEIMQPGVVAVSPLSRTLETARQVFGKRGSYVVVEALRERHGRFPCEQRRRVAEINKEYADYDFRGISERDELWQLDREPRDTSIARAQEALRWIANRPEKCIAVVSHAGFMSMSLFSEKNTQLVTDGPLALGFENCELRAVKLSFNEQRTKFHAKLVHTIKRQRVVDLDSEESDKKRKMLGHTNMSHLYAFTREQIESKLVAIRAAYPGAAVPATAKPRL